MARQGLLYAQTRQVLSREGGVELTNIRRFACQGQPLTPLCPEGRRFARRGFRFAAGEKNRSEVALGPAQRGRVFSP